MRSPIPQIASILICLAAPKLTAQVINWDGITPGVPVLADDGSFSVTLGFNNGTTNGGGAAGIDPTLFNAFAGDTNSVGFTGFTPPTGGMDTLGDFYQITLTYDRFVRYNTPVLTALAMQQYDWIFEVDGGATIDASGISNPGSSFTIIGDGTSSVTLDSSDDSDGDFTGSFFINGAFRTITFTQIVGTQPITIMDMDPTVIGLISPFILNIPEPSPTALLGIGILALYLRRRR